MLGHTAMNAQTAIQPAALPFAVPASRWDQAHAAALSPAELLLYRSNLLGSDLTVTNFGGGNTSAKLTETDPLTGQPVEVLWVKGSGGDIGSMQLDGFATLYQDRLLALEAHYGGPDDDDKMVGFLPHCTFNLNGRAASIDTPLHSLLPFAHVDHVHPDAVIALAASSGDAWITYGGSGQTLEAWFGHVQGLMGRFREAEAAAGRSGVRAVLSLDSSPQFSLSSVGVFEEMTGRAAALGFDDVVSHWPRPDGPYAGDEAVLEGLTLR